ncbi:zf-CCHC domain-containing protein [Tanacetum coccineum]
MEKDSEIYRGKKERVKSIALKAKKESSDDETSTSGSDDEEYAMAVRNFKKFFRRKGKFVRQPREEKKSFRYRDEKKGKSDRKCFRCGDPNHLIGDCPKPPRNKDQKVTKDDGNDGVEIIMVNIFPPDHVNDLPEVEPNQPEPALVDENEEPEEEEEFEDEEEFEEEEPQEEEEDMEVDIEEEDNEPELIFPYVEADPLNLPPPASDSESEDVVEVEDMVEPEDETVPNSVHEKGKAKEKYYGKLILDLGNEVRSSVEEGATELESLVGKFGNAEERTECKKLRKELEDTMLSNTLLSMQKE